MNNQGRDSNTILTNRSKYMTVVSDEPYSRRKFQKYGLLGPESQLSDQKRSRGSRPLHQTTLLLESLPKDKNYITTMKESFSGRYDMAPYVQPVRCPSLHTSQFTVGYNSQHHLMTTCKEKFTHHSQHPVAVHEDRSRWRREMAGHDMMNSTRHDNQIDFGTTYSRNHQQFSSDSECRRNNPRRTTVFNIINGQSNTTRSMFNSVSGNRILYKLRKGQVTDVMS